jgi:N-acetyl-gamma-glutamyl-phosphate reductase/acetylglutamate kinase
MKISALPSKQAERYITALQGFKPHRQLLIKVGGGLLQDETAVLELAEVLAELAKHDIHTVLVHGGGPQLSEAAKNLASEPRFIEGKRYTDEPTLELAKSIFGTITDNLVETFKANGIDAAAIPAPQLFSAKREPALGLVGTEITAIKTADIADKMKKHSVLVLAPLASDETTGETLNVNADTIFRALATELQPHRMTSLSPTGGVLKPINGSDTQELISGIDIRDVETLIAEGIVSGGMALKLRELATILNKLETGSAISITKPSDLLLELLTDQGSGTFVGKGPKIIRTDKLDDVFADFSALIKEVFGSSLPEGYQKQPIERVYFTADRDAFGIVTKLSDGTPYLDKLAVSPQLQGRGIGENLWYKITGDFPVLLWRSHVTNRYATWYHRHAEIMKRHGEWILFGRGVDFAKLESMAEELVAIPSMS